MNRISVFLEPTDLKLSLNKESRAIKLDLNALANDYCKGCTIKSTAYVEGVNKVLTRGYSQIKNFGAIPFTYKQMGVSPRIVPNSYKDSVQSVKKFLRDRIYNHLSIYSQREFNYSIIDLDIKSCYISILLGLYPEDLGIVQRAMEQGGLWNFIKDEFEHQGQGSLYNKPLAKICVYSSLFQGGIKAMVNGILEHFRKEVGLSPKEFRESDMFQDAYKIANDNAYLLNNSQIINSFRALSQQVLDTYKRGQLVGPTKHCYSVEGHNFRSAFPNYLQSYEFHLLANTVLNIKQRFRFELLGHFHDGVVLCIPEEKISEFEVEFERELNNIRLSLGLKYAIQIETKHFIS